MKIKVNYEQLEQKIKETLERAEGWQSNGGSGECQLYARFDESGNVYDFFITDFAGHNSWIESSDITCLFVQRWFNWDDNEDLGEWLKNELNYYDHETRDRFITWLKKNDYYDSSRDDDYNIWLNWDKFKYEFDSAKWEEYMEAWREVWFDTTGWEIVRDAINAITEDEEIEFV